MEQTRNVVLREVHDLNSNRAFEVAEKACERLLGREVNQQVEMVWQQDIRVQLETILPLIEHEVFKEDLARSEMAEKRDAPTSNAGDE